jgi:hypothetical protein
MPAKCNKCGELFDLSYDFEGLSDESRMIGMLKAVSLSRRKALLCWECRA